MLHDTIPKTQISGIAGERHEFSVCITLYVHYILVQGGGESLEAHLISSGLHSKATHLTPFNKGQTDDIVPIFGMLKVQERTEETHQCRNIRRQCPHSVYFEPRLKLIFRLGGAIDESLDNLRDLYGPISITLCSLNLRRTDLYSQLEHKQSAPQRILYPSQTLFLRRLHYSSSPSTQ